MPSVHWSNYPCILEASNTRYWYQKKYGRLPREVFVLHFCDQPSCRQIEHIWLGNQKENMQDCSRKGRNKGGNKSPETRLAISIAKKGIRRTDEEKRKISEKLKGRIPWNKGLVKKSTS